LPSEGDVRHVYRLGDGLVMQMDVVSARAKAPAVMQNAPNQTLRLTDVAFCMRVVHFAPNQIAP
jgi:hypothetical protein